MGLEHLGKLGEGGLDRPVAPLADLEGDERADLEAEATGSTSGPHPVTMPCASRRSSRACTVPLATAQPTGGLQDADPRLGAEEGQDPGVERVNRLLHAADCTD